MKKHIDKIGSSSGFLNADDGIHISKKTGTLIFFKN
jgi:hypothetical protein